MGLLPGTLATVLLKTLGVAFLFVVLVSVLGIFLAPNELLDVMKR